MHFRSARLGCVGKDRFTYFNGNQRCIFLSEESIDTCSRAEIDSAREERHIILVRHRESPFREGSERFIEIPSCGFGEDMEAALALVERVEGGIELLHSLEVIFGYRNSAYYVEEITDTGGKIGSKHRYAGGVSCAGGNQYGGAVQEIDVVGKGDEAVFELVFVLAQVLSAVYSHSHT